MILLYSESFVWLSETDSIEQFICVSPLAVPPDV